MNDRAQKTPESCTLETADFLFFIDFLRRKSGYHLTAEKKYLLESRIAPVMKTHRIPDIKSLIHALRQNQPPRLCDEVVEAMTVNETFFFRDRTPFESFEADILPQFARAGATRPFRVWSAACATGQEAYSLAMIVEENRARYPGLSCEIVATDINNAVIGHAQRAVFSDLETSRGLPAHYRDKYFRKDESGWKLTDSIRRAVTFRRMNLHGPCDIPGVFDFVLLRNVLIYFDEAGKKKVLSNIAQKMMPGGALLLGAAEGIYDTDHYFQRCARVKGLYRLSRPPA